LTFDIIENLEKEIKPQRQQDFLASFAVQKDRRITYA
jgi:hypothetical protein